jgi:phosphate transport system permease protein
MEPVTAEFGAATTLFGTLVTTFLSLLIAIRSPSALPFFVTEVSPDCLKAPIGMAIELLAAIPSIIYVCGGSLRWLP